MVVTALDRDPIRNHIYEGDCLDVLQTFDAESIDLIVTSPPYADRRKHIYSGVHPDDCSDWFTPIGLALVAVLMRVSRAPNGGIPQRSRANEAALLHHR